MDEIHDEEILEPVEEEEVDGLPVLADVHAIEPAAPTVLPTVQAAAAAATGFVAGAATVAFVRRRAARRAAGALASRVPGNGWPVGATRTFLVHVQVIGRPPQP
jgi:hypothetical protein